MARKKPREDQGVSPDTLPEAQANLKLTTDQRIIYEKLCQSIDKQEFKTFLLHGVTGSGKTEVYIRCIQRILQMGKTAIMLVPEISLTPQTVSRFLSRFGRQVAILHSGLSQIERFQEWEKVRAGKVSIVVGARSAVFAPFENLGIIVIDEEHDASYKQDNSPRYHARDTAIVRAKAQNATIILGSATPSIETRNNAESGKYQYLALNSRVQDRLLPVIRILDMKKERMERKNFSILSNDIKSGIRLRLDRNEQTFLFLNRRGTANYVYCKECGYVFNCHRCSVTMTYHGTHNRFRCHYCNHSARVPDRCAECNGEVIKFSGFGTQKLEEETRKLFPEARILRLDRDTTQKRSAFETMHSDMVKGNIDILIGTQMIAKGHDFPNVTLVGVVHADLSLNIPDFRSCERSFQLLAQVAGRAGRGEVPGLVILQTHTPNHYVYDFVREHNYEKFFRKEMDFRRLLNYPPYTRMVALEITSDEEALGESLAKKIKIAVSKLLKTHKDVELLGPSRAALYRLNNKFRWHIILRSASVRSLRAVLENIRDLTEWKPGSKGKVKLSIDVDPVNLL
jgi:primosomal protein N' (replication factor Y)